MTEITRLLSDLVSLPSVNPMGRSLQGPEIYEHRVTAYLEELFRGLGVPFERQPVAPLRENIIARYDSPGARRTIILEAHQDTVPVDNMTIEPFTPKIEGDRLYGRGSCDIKGGMAAMLAAFARLVREKPKGAANVLMACSVDEEYTTLGVRRMAQSIKADMAVVAEPTQLNIVHAHKGICRWFLTVLGRSCHSSVPEKGENAIYRMARVVSSIEKFAAKLRNSRSDPLLGPPTMSVGRIEGGTSVNTVPDRCRIEIDRRIIPGENPKDAPEELIAFLRGEGGIDFPFECAEPWSSKEALSPKGADELITRLGAAVDSVKGSHRLTAVPYGTDAPALAEAGIPTVVFGPDDIAKAHTCDEWVSLAEVEQASEILYRFVTKE
jgi:acetylornithine deacetylase